MAVGIVQELVDEPAGRLDAILEGGVGIRLAQDGDAVAEPDVAVVEARPIVERLPDPLTPPGLEVAVVVIVPVVSGLDRLGDRWQPLLPEEVDDRRIGGRVERRRVRQVVAMVRSVRGVEIDGHLRVVIAQQLDERPPLRGVELHVIAVQVVVLGVRSLALSCSRAVLAPPAVGCEPLVAVRVVDGGDQQHHALQPVRVFSFGELPEEHQR